MKLFKILKILAVLLVLYSFWSINSRLSNIERRFGGTERLKCEESEVQKLLQSSVVRIIGSLGEGSGFPISDHEIITNFHVIEGESSPKVVFSDGTFENPTKIVATSKKDIAVLTLERKLTPLPYFGYMGTSGVNPEPTFGEPVYAGGYPLGVNLPGDVTINKGSYGGKRFIKDMDMGLIQTDISLVPGMSGGPLVNACGQVLGVNTAGLSGLSVFLDIIHVQRSFGELTDEETAKILIDTSTPEGVVKAFYAYIKARDLKKAYELVSEEKLDGWTFDQWDDGYANTLQVDLIASKVDEKDKNKIYVKLVSLDWVDGELISKYFEGYWIVNENLQLHESNIKEVQNPDWDWFYTDGS